MFVHSTFHKLLSKMKKYEQLTALVESIAPEVTKFYEGKNKAAGTRARVMLQAFKALAQEMRQEILETKGKLAVKSKK